MRKMGWRKEEETGKGKKKDGREGREMEGRKMKGRTEESIYLENECRAKQYFSIVTCALEHSCLDTLSIEIFSWVLLLEIVPESEWLVKKERR